MFLKREYNFPFYLPVVLFCLLLLFTLCGERGGQDDSSAESDNLTYIQKIKQSGRLNVVVDNNSMDYFIYRGVPMGFQYAMITALCRELGVQPIITVNNSLEESFEGVKIGRYDLIAKNLTITRERESFLDFTTPLNHTTQVLVQRRYVKGESDSTFIRSTPELAGKDIYIQKNSSFYRRLIDLSDDIGERIEIIEDSINGSERLVSMVASGEIDYTVCDENRAKINQAYYPNLDISLKISYPQYISWAVRKGENEWRDYLNEWLKQFRLSGKYREIYQLYYVSPRTSGRFRSGFHSASGGKISEFDPIVKELSKKHGWDWRLISSIIYHESRFDPDAESWGGAMGLMQLMPETAASMGVEDILDPYQSVEGGLKLLNWLDKQFISTVPDSVQRVRFVLAAYNIGLGHVKDAQRLAAKYGRDSLIWDDNVDLFLKNKSLKAYFNDPVVKWGYCRGEEAYNHVYRVLENYNHYYNLMPE